MDNVKWIKNWIDEFLAANPDDKLQQRVTTIVARLSQQLDEIERQEAQGQEERKQQIARKQAEEKAAADAKAVEDARRQAEAEAVSNAQKRRQQAEAEAEAQAKAAADAQRRQAEAAAKLSVFDKSAGKPAVSQQSSAVPGEIAILNSRIANLTDKVTRLENDNKELQSKAEQLKQLQASNPALTDKITKLEQDIETERKARARDIVIHQTALAEAEEKARNLLQAYNNQLAAQAQVVQAPIQVIQPQSKPLSRKAIIAEYRSAQAAFQRDPNNTTKYARLQSAMRAFLDR
jgi:DNA repair exonuclease SbcCD ATPase subunit